MRARPKRCKVCGRPEAFPNEMSARGKCLDCGEFLRQMNARQISAHDGPWFDHWRRAMAASVGAVIPERDEKPETV